MVNTSQGVRRLRNPYRHPLHTPTEPAQGEVHASDGHCPDGYELPGLGTGHVDPHRWALGIDPEARYRPL